MCGIVAIIGSINNVKYDKAFKHLLILDALRGIDSTGIVTVDQQGVPIVAKQVGNPYELLDTGPFNRAMTRNNKVLIGHNRFATQGLVNKKNAHPFEFDTLVGVHNGTLTSKWRLADNRDFVVDSENLYHHIDKHGLKDAMDLSEGAWSLIWWDRVNQTVNLLRNKERPMFVGWEKKTGVMMCASEEWMLHIAAARNDIELEDVGPTTIDTHYEYFINNKGEVEDVGQEEVKGGAKCVYTNHSNYGRNVVVQGPFGTGGKPTNLTPLAKVELPSKKVEASGVISSTGYLDGYAKSTDVTVEVLSVNRDEYGTAYLSCYDPENPTLTLRLFLNRKDKAEKYLGKEIVCNIGKFFYKPGNREGYYKIDYSSHRFTKQEVDPQDQLYLNTDGELVSMDKWMAKHGECCWCTANVWPHEKHRFTKNLEVLCGACCEDKEIAQYVI